MKKIIICLLLLFSRLSFAEIGLYTSDSKASHQISEMSEMLEKMTRENPEKNILFYVHGRSHTLEKEWNKIPIIEDAYNVKVIMFHWDAWTSKFSRPVENADIAAEPLSDAFREIRDFKESHREFFTDRSISLLCHSMGNLVLKNFTEKFLNNDNYNLDSPLFENFMGVGADIPMVDHALWLTPFNLAKKKHILMNNRDIILLLSLTLDAKNGEAGPFKLGLGFDNIYGKKNNIKNKLVKDISYIDFSDVLGSEHGYYLPKTPLMHNVFSKLVNGRKFEINEEEKKLFKVKLKFEKNLIYVKDN